MLYQEVLNTLLQVAIALGLVGLTWVAIGRRSTGFRQWAGLYLPPADAWGKSTLLWLALACFSIPMLAFGPMGELASGPGTIGARLAEIDNPATLAALIAVMALFKTALAEEIVFRGLIAKRLINWLGFGLGNFAQALIFGLIHLAVFAVPGSPAPTVTMILVMLGMPSLAGWLMGYANERFGNGSIAPGWLMHAVGNSVGYTIMATYLA